MAILKTLIDITDFDQYDAFTSTVHVDLARVDQGFAWNNGESLVASWEEPVGNSIWIHMRYGQSGFSSGWDDFGVFEFKDANGTVVLRFDVFDSNYRWVVFGDTTPSRTFRANDDNPFFWDINFVKNGTTDLTIFVYQSGQFRGAATTANSVDNGLPVAFATFNTDGAQQSTCYMSEGIIADEDTRGMRVRQHRIRSHGETSDWEGSALGLIDRRADWGLHSNTLDQRAAFGISRLEDVPVGVLIDRVWLQAKAMRGATGLTRFNTYFRWENNTVVDGADQLLTEDLRYYEFEYTTSPDTTNRWSHTEFPGLQIGVRART